MNNDDVIGRSRMLPPLPERMRPHDLDGYVGQKHLVGKGCILRNMLETGNLSSFILWGPPGVGKTTLSRIVASSLEREFFTLSAVSAGVKDVREVIDRARSNSLFSGGAAPQHWSGCAGACGALLAAEPGGLPAAAGQTGPGRMRTGTLCMAEGLMAREESH